MTCSPCPSTRSLPSWGAHRPRPGNSRAAHAVACGELPRSRTPIFARRRKVVDAFLAAARGGDFGALVAFLDPAVVLRADQTAVQMGASREVRGAAVADTFSGCARVARPALVNGAAGVGWARRGRTRVVFGFRITDGKIVEIDLIADPDRLRELDPVVLGD